MLKIKEEHKNLRLSGGYFGNRIFEVNKMKESEYPFYFKKFPWLFENIEENSNTEEVLEVLEKQELPEENKPKKAKK